MSGTLSIQIKADETDLRANLALANQDLKTHNAEVRNLAAAAAEASGAMKDQLVQQLRAATVETARASAEVAKLKGELKGAGEEKGLLATFDALKGRFASMSTLGGEIREFAEAFMAAFAVEKIAEWVNEITEAGAKVEHLSQQLGMPAEEISKLGFAAQAMGMGLDQSASMLERLERNASEAQNGTGKAAKAFAELGISVQDSNGHIKSGTELLNQIADAFAGLADGPNKTALAMELMGRAGAEMIPLLNQGSAGLKDMGDAAERAGAVISGAMAEGMERTSINTNEMMEALKGVSLTLYEAFKPALDAVIAGIINLVENFNDWMKSSVAGHDTLISLVAVVDAIVMAVGAFSLVCKEAYEIVTGTFTGMMDDAKALGVVMEDVFTGKWGRISRDYKLSMNQMALDAAATQGRMLTDAADFAAQMKALMAGLDGKPPEEPPPKKKPPDAPAPDAEGNKSAMEAFQATLTQELLAKQLFGQQAKAFELQYWEDTLATIKGAGAEQVAERTEINAKIYALEEEMHQKIASSAKSDAEKSLALDNQVMAEHLAIQRQDTQTTIQIREMELQANVQNLDTELAEHKITAAQKIAAEEDYAAQKLALDLQSIQTEIDAGNLSLVELDKLNNQKLILQEQYTLALTKLQHDAAVAQAKDQTDAAKTWAEALQPVGRSFDTMLEGMLEHRETFNAAMLKLADQLVNGLISFATRELTHWVSMELAKTSATTAGTAVRTSAQVAGAAEGRAADAATGSADVLGNAHKAFAGAYAAVAGIPIVGPILAPVAGATAFAAVAAMDVFSAEGGMERVPYDNAPALLHTNEMVMPARIADPMREFFSGGSTNTHFGGDTHNHFSPTINVSGSGGKGVGVDDIMKALKNAHRNNAFA